ncbi:MAG TPA: universal stress protein [Gemmatimonadaceae bacterium]
MIALGKILVATDFGPAADAALDYGRALARTFGGSLHVLHITEDLMFRMADAYGYAMLPAGAQEDLERAALRQTEALLSEEDRRELHALAVVFTSVSPATAIVDYARVHEVDLIVMGTHGRGAVAHFLMGSVAERVVRTAPCPVLTVRESQKGFVRPDALVAVLREQHV